MAARASTPKKFGPDKPGQELSIAVIGRLSGASRGPNGSGRAGKPAVRAAAVAYLDHLAGGLDDAVQRRSRHGPGADGHERVAIAASNVS
jgi:hypothetical protein